MNGFYRSRMTFLILLMSFLVTVSFNACKRTSISHKYITEDDIREMIYEVETANKNRDMKGVLRYMSPDIEIYINMDTILGPQQMQWTLTRYKIETENAWSNASSYTYERQNDKITISDDGQSAHVETDIFEVITVQGKTVKQKAHEKIDIKIVNGELMVTKLEAFIKT